MKVMDEDNIQDECAGSLVFDLKELLQKVKVKSQHDAISEQNSE